MNGIQSSKMFTTHFLRGTLTILFLMMQVKGTGWTCAKDWFYFNGSCYRAYNTKLSWFYARAACQENGGDLLSINSDGEQKFVYRRMAVNKTFWIGLVKDQSSKNFRWSKGEELTYLNWISQPNISGPEDCGEMTDYGSFHGWWNDKSCSEKQPYICEKDAASGRYFKRSPNTQLTKHVIHQLVVQSDIECLLWCRRYQNCTSVNYRPGEAPSTSLCEINAAIANEFPGDVVESKEFDYYEALG